MVIDETEPLRLLVTGSRVWPAAHVVESVIRQWWNYAALGTPRRKLVVVHGNAHAGADSMADAYVRRMDSPDELIAEPHPARWAQRGKAAGMVRNQEMVDAGANVCAAFIWDQSRGATHCRDAAVKAGIPTVTYRIDPADPGTIHMERQCWPTQEMLA